MTLHSPDTRPLTDMARQMADYRLTTATILYHMPDHPGLLQEYIWQQLDLAPRFPELRRFLDFWTRELDGPLHSVRVASAALITPARYRSVDCLLVH
ncbi:MAG: usg protein [Rhodospirillum sp.]|nr:usg protein [Rhodospirillum sp.]MCF8491242.1 usg protein [Rhodospirillum sp.]MCF8500782.1 usg protein [Rhodospirillum sp.]